MRERDDAVDRLLHDAERAEGGAMFARMMADESNARLLDEKAQRLRAEAEALDPNKEAPAWTA